LEEGIGDMILVLNVCRERLHYYEFVKPVEDVLKSENIEFETFHYKQLNDRVLSRVDKVIICGTSLKDSRYLDDLDRFEDMFRYFDLHNKDVSFLGICAGFQILGKLYGGGLKKSEKEIGFFRENFSKDFFGLKGDVEVYHLHGNYVEFGEDWDVYSGKDFSQAVRHKHKKLSGVLFHPEVRNKEMILRWCCEKD
jgi:GMP synthase-like glutamine amidotransferase